VELVHAMPTVLVNDIGLASIQKMHHAFHASLFKYVVQVTWELDMAHNQAGMHAYFPIQMKTKRKIKLSWSRVDILDPNHYFPTCRANKR
jgi:hypothetical protein